MNTDFDLLRYAELQRLAVEWETRPRDRWVALVIVASVAWLLGRRSRA